MKFNLKFNLNLKCSACHRSYAIALAFIQAYNQKEVTITGQKLPIGASYREGLMKRLAL